MPQGKIKTKTNVQKPTQKKHTVDKKKGIQKKGKFDLKSKKLVKGQVQKFQKQVQKDINARIETDLKNLAVRQGEGKLFRTLDTKVPEAKSK